MQFASLPDQDIKLRKRFTTKKRVQQSSYSESLPDKFFNPPPRSEMQKHHPRGLRIPSNDEFNDEDCLPKRFCRRHGSGSKFCWTKFAP
jgi:hypothetical protein